MALIKINNVIMPNPIQYSVPMCDMESSDSTYSESGLRIRNRVRQGIVRIELGWRVFGEDVITLLSAIKPSRVEVEYLDPKTGTVITAQMYVEDRSCNLISYKGNKNPEENIWEISFSLIEY